MIASSTVHKNVVESFLFHDSAGLVSFKTTGIFDVTRMEPSRSAPSWTLGSYAYDLLDLIAVGELLDPGFIEEFKRSTSSVNARHVGNVRKNFTRTPSPSLTEAGSRSNGEKVRVHLSHIDSSCRPPGSSAVGVVASGAEDRLVAVQRAAKKSVHSVPESSPPTLVLDDPEAAIMAHGAPQKTANNQQEGHEGHNHSKMVTQRVGQEPQSGAGRLRTRDLGSPCLIAARDRHPGRNASKDGSHTISSPDRSLRVGPIRKPPLAGLLSPQSSPSQQREDLSNEVKLPRPMSLATTTAASDNGSFETLQPPTKGYTSDSASNGLNPPHGSPRRNKSSVVVGSGLQNPGQCKDRSFAPLSLVTRHQTSPPPPLTAVRSYQRTAAKAATNLCAGQLPVIREVSSKGSRNKQTTSAATHEAAGIAKKEVSRYCTSPVVSQPQANYHGSWKAPRLATTIKADYSGSQSAGNPRSASPSGSLVDHCVAVRHCLERVPVAEKQRYFGAAVVERYMDTSQHYDVAMELHPAEMIDPEKLRLSKIIAKGTFGMIIQGSLQSSSHAISVAVKIPHRQKSGMFDQEQARSLVREIQTYRTIYHPGALTYIGTVALSRSADRSIPVASEDTVPPLVWGDIHGAILTDYMPHGNLFDLLYDETIKLTAAQRLKLARQLVSVLHSLHVCPQCPLMHRDLKTSNLLLDRNFDLRLCDFGKTRPMQNGYVRLDDNGGTPRYMAPECFTEGGYVSLKSDIWSLACCVVEIFGGPIPYEDQVEWSASPVTLGRVPEVPPSFHGPLQSVLRKCFSWEASLRPDLVDISVVLHEITAENVAACGMDSSLRNK